jgi:hypothetical protein
VRGANEVVLKDGVVAADGCEALGAVKDLCEGTVGDLGVNETWWIAWLAQVLVRVSGCVRAVEGEVDRAGAA